MIARSGGWRPIADSTRADETAVSREDRAGMRERFEDVDLKCASAPRLNSRQALLAASGVIV